MPGCRVILDVLVASALGWWSRRHCLVSAASTPGREAESLDVFAVRQMVPTCYSLSSC